MNSYSGDKEKLKQFISNTISIDHDLLDQMTIPFKEKVIKKGELFLEEGKVSNEYLYLETGFMRSFLCDTEGNEVTLNFFSANNVVFEVASFFQRIPSQENIQALSDCTGWMLNFDDLNALFHNIPAFREFGRAQLVKGFIVFKSRTFAMINKSAEQRYEALMKYNPEILQQAPLKYIASYLGITDTSLSRIRKEFAGK